jgi:flagellin
MAGTVVNEGNADKTFSGSVNFADQGKNMQFSANTGNGLDTRYYDLKVTDSFTFIFSKYDAASSALNDSLMSQIGANSGQTTFLSINDMRCKALGVSDVDISTKWGAATAIETVNNALQKVSHQRSSLGALQNRLEHTIKNLDTAAENLQAAESRIRDVDMAKEVMEFTRNNILQQASQAMLAQANQQPQSVLQLLR